MYVYDRPTSMTFSCSGAHDRHERRGQTAGERTGSGGVVAWSLSIWIYSVP